MRAVAPLWRDPCACRAAANSWDSRPASPRLGWRAELPHSASPGDNAPAAAAGAPPAPIDLRRYPNLRPFKNRPPLPALVVPLDVVEPRRDVRASEWASPYCTDWSDGLERCVRSAALTKPICVPGPAAGREQAGLVDPLHPEG